LFWRQWFWQGKRRGENFYSSEVQNTYNEWELFNGDVSFECINYSQKYYKIGNPNPYLVMKQSKSTSHNCLSLNCLKIYKVHNRLVIRLGNKGRGRRRASYQYLSIGFIYELRAWRGWNHHGWKRDTPQGQKHTFTLGRKRSH
jgi:hypothetical protein